jgi:hypothetical protein
MLTVRCTTKLLKSMRVDDAPKRSTPDSRLGDWYAVMLHMRPHDLALLVNEPTRLAAVMPLRDFAPTGGKIAEAILRVLEDLGAEPGVLERERCAMADVAFARPSNRSISESMNELTSQLEQLRESNPAMSDHALGMKLGQVSITIPRLGRQRPAELAKRVLEEANG